MLFHSQGPNSHDAKSKLITYYRNDFSYFFVISSAHCKDMPVFYCYVFHVGFKFHLLLLYRIHIITFFIDFKITYSAHNWLKVCILVLITFGTDDVMSSGFNILDRIPRFSRFFVVLCKWYWCLIKYYVWCWLTDWNLEM